MLNRSTCNTLICAFYPTMLLGLLLYAGQAKAIVFTCSTSGGSDCPSGVDSISNLNAPVQSTITVPAGTCAAGSITDVNINLDITHSFVGDLDVTVTEPGATTVDLLDEPGVPAMAGGGCPSDDINATFDDASMTPAEDECAVPPPAIAGSVSPTSPLAAFNGGNGDGIWTLTITDTEFIDAGELNDWSLDITCTLLAPAAIPALSLWGLVSLLTALGVGGRVASRRFGRPVA